ncbi:MAG: permease, partial [Candidatus Berkelbacteria bacterium]
FLPPQKIRALLSHKFSFFNYILAGLLGIVTPFCTCSAIPLFIGFVQAGVPLGVTFSFLVASPMINEVAIVMLLGLFGWKIMLLYIFSGLLISVVSGSIIGQMKPEKLLEKSVFNEAKLMHTANQKNWRGRLLYAKSYTQDMLSKVWLYIVIGVGLGALIHGYVPADFLVRFAGASKWYAVPLATLLGVPLYANAAGVMPLVAVLTEKGVAIGTTLAFMMAVTGLSLPEFLILKRIMKLKLILIFAGIVSVGIVLTGYLFNYILK